MDSSLTREADCIDYIASKVLGQVARAVFKCQIEEGKVNKGIKVFVATSLGGAGPRKLFVEKATANQQEWMIAARLAALRENGDPLVEAIPVPSCYGVAPVNDKIRLIYQDFAGGCGAVGEWDLSLAQSIAEVAYQFTIGVTLLYLKAGVKPREVPYLNNRHSKAIRRKFGLQSLVSITRMIAEVEYALSSFSPKVLCHNDIVWPNISIVDDHSSGSKGILLIDLGLTGMNYAGAEYHHFALASQSSDSRASIFFDSITSHAADLHRLPLGKIRAAAYLYAAIRKIRRGASRNELNLAVPLRFLQVAKGYL